MQTPERERKTERKILIFAFLGCLISLPFVFESFYLSVFPQAISTQGIYFGNVSNMTSDVRLKRNGFLAWNNATPLANVFLGDTLFVGEGSTSQVQAKDNTLMIFGSNTLVHFTTLNGFDVPEISGGNVQFIIKGSTKIVVGGELLEIAGQDTDVQMYFDENGKPVFRTLRGFMTVNKLGSGVIAQTPLPAEPPPLELAFQDETYSLRWQDLYTLEPNRHLKLKSPETMTIRTRQALNLNAMPVGETYQLQISAEKTFAEPLTSTLVGGSTQRIPDAFIGTNFVRVSNKNKKVFAVGTFRVLSTTFPAATLVRNARYDYSTEILSLDLEADQPAQAFIVEFSKDSVFNKEDEKRIIPIEELKNIPYRGYGRLWIRVQAVLENDLVTDFSRGSSVMLKPWPVKIGVPILTLNTQNATASEQFQVAWTPVPGADGYVVDWINPDGEIVSQTTKDTQLTYKPSKNGLAGVRVRALKGKDQGAFSEVASVDVRNALPYITKPALEIVKNVESRSSVKRPPVFSYDGLNRLYDSNSIMVEPGGFVAISSGQNNTAEQEAMATILTVRVNHWIQNWGIDAMARMQVFGLTEQAQKSQLQDFDARILYRLDHEWLKLRSHFPVVSLGLGVENYRNQGASVYSQGYDLMKAGFRINFPTFRNWSAGGEVYYGLASDQSNKTEISGNFGYFFKENLSAGLGYRFSLFEAKTAATSPGPLPYREAYGEGYSILRFHY